ncbi:MAG: MFS transporter [Actinomycetota bacterium]|nr:MAG: MFS transporter [Actinomycetota bacterium]
MEPSQAEGHDATASASSSPEGMAKDIISAVAAAASTSFAVFLTGALAVQMRSTLHFGPDALGMSISIYYIGAAAGSVPFGRLTEAVGGVRIMKPTAVVAGGLLALIALFVHSWLGLSIVLFFSGIVSSAMQPATNLFLARRIPRSRQGFAFGVKQSAIPFAALFGGLAVPGIALTIGWRWAFVAAAAWSVVTAVAIPRSRTSLAAYRARHKDPVPKDDLAPLIVLGIGFGLGIFAAAAMTGFLVISAVDGGLSRSNAGYVAGIAGLIAVIARIYVGIAADRRGAGHFKVVAGMLVIGCIGYGALAIGSASRVAIFFWIGAFVAFGAGWGWNGLFNYAVIQTHQRSPARATAVTQVGGRLASVFGPLVFGLLVSNVSYSVAWMVNGLVALGGAAIIMYGRHMLLGPGKHIVVANP